MISAEEWYHEEWYLWKNDITKNDICGRMISMKEWYHEGWYLWKNDATKNDICGRMIPPRKMHIALDLHDLLVAHPKPQWPLACWLAVAHPNSSLCMTHPNRCPWAGLLTGCHSSLTFLFWYHSSVRPRAAVFGCSQSQPVSKPWRCKGYVGWATYSRSACCGSPRAAELSKSTAGPNLNNLWRRMCLIQNRGLKKNDGRMCLIQVPTLKRMISY